MTFTISGAEYSLLEKYNTQPGKYNLVLEDNEILIEQPASLGQHGYTRSWEFSPGIELSIFNWISDRDLILKMPTSESPIEMVILNSGYVPGSQIYPTIGGKQALFSGSGIAPAYPLKFLGGQQATGAAIYLEPEVFGSFFCDLDLNSAFGKQIIKQDDWAESFFPQVTPLIRSLVQQIINTPYRGTIRKLYLQAKVLELLAIQLDPIMAEFNHLPAKSSLKPSNIDRIYQARDILANQLENPPSILELAQQVGVSDRTLRRGFKEIFNTTVLGYYTQKRLEKANQLLREGELSLSEVGNLVGYCNLSHFAAAFKRQFGITPSECKKGRLEKLSN
ncbi:MAG: AraC family transcriptional regulator [Cyanobacteria bacterium P01_A01_bin.83]